ncbi:MAG TPA: class I SAM-dependent methyltransferase, partial [Terricaulis sp.]|nr:class I SAM-dependent methyltransferase [Terricaulis sp.]
MTKTIGFYPPIRDQKDQADLLARATWYLWPWRARIGAIKMWSLPLPAALDAQAGGFDPSIERQYPDISALIAAEAPPETDSDARQALIRDPCDLLFVWRSPRTHAERSDLSALRQATEARGGLVYVVDPAHAQYEGSFYLWGCHNAMGDEAAYIEENRRKFAALKQKPRRDRVYVFGTGPSLDLAPQLDFSDGDAIVCNSIVGNEALLDRVKPFALVAGDPIFHAGCSQYAAEFREKLRHVLETRDIVFVTVMRDYVQQLAQLPAHLHDKVIALPFAPDRKKFRFDFEHDFQLSPEGNVLMLLLLPLGAALYDHISVCGCDGRPLDENKYFWSHHSASQFSADRMKNIQLVHPAFFERSYDDHYSEHIADVARVVDAIEDAGKRVDTLTPSYVPALAMRQVWSVRALANPEAKPALLVSVNPDATDAYGHWLGYDRHLAAESARRGVAFIALGNRKLAESVLRAEPHLRRAFEHETWGAGNQPLASISPARLLEFEQSLRREVAAIRAEHPERERVYYLYTGSLPHALAMYRIARDNHDDCFVVNTFWTSTMDCEAGGYMRQWGAFLRAAQAQTNLRVLALTHQLRAIITKDTGVTLPLAPHPTPSMRAPEDRPPRARDRSAPLTVLFPGGMTEEKGFRDIPGILRAMRSAMPAARFIVRATRTNGVISRDETLLAIRGMAQTVDQVMDDAAFLDWLQTADIAVLPYRATHWRYRNSAILVDLLYLGVPVVCARGTWLADVIERHGGGITVDGDDPAAYAAAVESIAASIDAYRARARAAARSYHASNSWPQMLDTVLAPAFAPRAQSAAWDADQQAPIHYWVPGAPVAAAMPESLEQQSQQPAFAPAPVRAAARLKAFAIMQILRSRRVQALLLAAALCIGLIFAPISALAPIRTHLVALGLLALAGAGASTLFRFLADNAEAVRARIHARSESMSDLVGAFARVLAGRGIIKKLMIGAAGVFALAWLGTYALRLNGLTSQFWLEVVFWVGGAFTALSIAGMIAVQTLLHGGRRILARWQAYNAMVQEDRLRAATMQINRELRPMLEQANHSAASLREAMDAVSDSMLSAASFREALDSLAQTTVSVQTFREALNSLAQSTVSAQAFSEAFDTLSKTTITALEDTVRRQQGLEVTGRRFSRELEEFRTLVAGFGDGVTRSAADVGARFDALSAKLESVEAAVAEAERVEAQRLADIANVEKELLAHIGALDASMREADGAHAARVEALAEKHERLLAMATKKEEIAADAKTAAVTLAAALQASQHALAGKLEAVEAALAAKLEASTTKAAEDTKQALSGMEKAIAAKVDASAASAADTAKKALAGSKENKALADNVKQLGEDMRALKTGGFQSFDRYLSKQDQQDLASALSKSLKLSVTGHNLNYMAHQVRELEARARGRIAAPVSDVLVRTAALLAVDRKDPAVIEIGTLFGLGAASMWTIARPRFEKLSLTLVDPLDGYYGDDYLPSTDDIITGVPVERATLEHNLRQAGVPESEVQVVQHLSQSPEALAAVEGKRFDVLIIDGDHSYEGARRDYENYAPLLREGGFVIFDDYGVDIWQGVTDFANDAMGRDSNLERVLFHGRTLICRVAGPLLKAEPAANGAVQ